MSSKELSNDTFGSNTTWTEILRPQVWPDWGSNSWPPDHDSIFCHWDACSNHFGHWWLLLVTSIKAGVMYDHALFHDCISPDQTSGHKWKWQSAWWLQMVSLIFLRGLCGYVWVNVPTLSPLRISFFWGINYKAMANRSLHQQHSIGALQCPYHNWCTGTPLNKMTTTQWEGVEDLGSARYELTLLPPCPTIRVLSYSNCQRSTNSISKWIFRNLTF